MAEVTQTQQNGKRGFGRQKKLSTRIDLTPMVDLGFLLITFFIFTTTMAKPTAMKLILPDDRQGSTSLTGSEKTLSIILGKNDDVFYYYGIFSNNVYKTSYSANGIRNVISEKMKQVALKFGNSHLTTVLIKPTPYASYENIVNVLDEMVINGVDKYVLMEADKKETEAVVN